MMTNERELSDANGMSAESCAALTTIPATALGSFQRGMEWLESGQPSQALAAFSSCIEQAPEFSDAHLGAGIAHARNSDVYPAMDHLELAAKLSPESFISHFTLAQFYFKLRIPQKGYKAAEEALRTATSRSQRLLLGQLLQQERARSHHGIARPWWYKPFTITTALLGGCSAVAALGLLLLHLR